MNALDIKSVIELACEATGIPNLASEIKVEYSSRMTVTGGKAKLRAKTIIIGIPFWKAATEEDQEQLIYHEACHIIVFAIFAKTGHGFAWKSCMKLCGREPEIYHNVETPAIKRREANMKTVFCWCQEHKISPTQYKNMTKWGQQYICKTCKATLTLEKQPTRTFKITPIETPTREQIAALRRV